MKKQLAFGDHYQLDPNAVGFIGVHVERDKAKIFTPASFKDILCSTLRNLRHHKEEEPFKSSANILSHWCLKMGKEKFYVTRKKIVSELNKNEILETNTANFGLIVERMYAVIFKISNNAPLQRFCQAGKWNHWVKKILKMIRIFLLNTTTSFEEFLIAIFAILRAKTIVYLIFLPILVLVRILTCKKVYLLVLVFPLFPILFVV